MLLLEQIAAAMMNALGWKSCFGGKAPDFASGEAGLCSGHGQARLFFLPWDTASGAQAGYARHFIGRQVEVT